MQIHIFKKKKCIINKKKIITYVRTLDLRIWICIIESKDYKVYMKNNKCVQSFELRSMSLYIGKTITPWKKIVFQYAS